MHRFSRDMYMHSYRMYIVIILIYFSAPYFQILHFPWKRQSPYLRKIRAWRSTLSVIFEYGFRARRSREYKISARGNTPPWRSSRVSRTGVCACLVTGTMSRRLSTMGFADVTTFATNPLHPSSASPSLSLRRIEKERKKERKSPPRSSSLFLGFRGESSRTREGKIHDLWRQRYCSPKCEKVSGGGGAFEFSTPLTRTSRS